jgi:hypothetical protein
MQWVESFVGFLHYTLFPPPPKKNIEQCEIFDCFLQKNQQNLVSFRKNFASSFLFENNSSNFTAQGPLYGSFRLFGLYLQNIPRCYSRNFSKRRLFRKRTRLVSRNVTKRNFVKTLIDRDAACGRLQTKMSSYIIYIYSVAIYINFCKLCISKLSLVFCRADKSPKSGDRTVSQD